MMPNQLAIFLDEIARRSGRRGDVRLAHVTPREEAILSAFGGSGSINPMTGLREYFQIGSGGPEGISEQDIADTYNEWAYFGDQQDEQPEAYPPEVYSGMTSPIDPSIGATAIKTISGALGLAPIGVAATGLEKLFGPGETPDYMPAGASGVQSGEYGLGFGDIGYSPDDPEEERASPTALARTTGKGLTRAQQQRTMPLPKGPPPLVRPLGLSVPTGLHVPSYMNPLQQRSYIATQGIEGMGPYRGEEAQQYWTNLALRSILSDTGDIVPGGGLLPIELQYMRDVMGMEAPAEGDTQALLRALSTR